MPPLQQFLLPTPYSLLPGPYFLYFAFPGAPFFFSSFL